MKKNKGSVGIVVVSVIAVLALIGLVLGLVFFTLNWTTGEHGRLTITAVDKNLFGTHTVYVRNSESLSGNEKLEVTYCIDATDVELTKRVKDAIGKKNTTLIYPKKRIGFFWFDKCHSSPIKDIKLEG